MEKDRSQENKLLADFVGLIIRYEKEYTIFMENEEYEMYIDCPNSFDHDEQLMYLYEEDAPYEKLKFHSSWDWLMPVGKKIFDWLQEEIKTRPPHTASRGDLIECDISCAIREYDIEKAYEQIVRFIEWYNTRKQ